jgi:hypothetical protein
MTIQKRLPRSDQGRTHCLPAVPQLAGSAPVQATWLAPCSHACSHAACMLPASFLEAACSLQALPHGREQEACLLPFPHGDRA